MSNLGAWFSLSRINQCRNGHVKVPLVNWDYQGWDLPWDKDAPTHHVSISPFGHKPVKFSLLASLSNRNFPLLVHRVKADVSVNHTWGFTGLIWLPSPGEIRHDVVWPGVTWPAVGVQCWGLSLCSDVWLFNKACLVNTWHPVHGHMYL